MSQMTLALGWGWGSGAVVTEKLTTLICDSLTITQEKQTILSGRVKLERYSLTLSIQSHTVQS